ncbi:MAG: FAD-dependent oxidoreductase [bacterium]|nr:FAD-dependent oxidoreductase [bacterium]
MSRITLTIDGREVTVERGTTLLDAARSIGVEIPTLCHVPGHEPAASCFLCCVQVEGIPRLSPACALPADDGMRVVTGNEEILAARKMALELLLSDHAGDCIAPCRAGCPAGLDIAGFVYEIASDQPERAMDVIFDRLALPGSLGRICPHLCEQSCRRRDYDRHGLAIAALHRWTTDRHLENGGAPPLPGPASGKSVGVVGAGPAGLSAAFYLRLAGHACTVHDACPSAGGMLRYGIPDYRLPAAALDAEIDLIEDLGVELRAESRWGRDFSLTDLRREHDAVFLAIGAWHSRSMRCTGEEHALSGLEFLRRVAEQRPPDVGERVVVVGGGNTAMDAARSALRLGASVEVIYRRTREEMPCLMEEIEAAEQEGVNIRYLAAPWRLARAGDGGIELACHRMRLGEPDESGRRRPIPIPHSEFVEVCDTVISAVGQAVELEVAERDGLNTTAWGIAADPTTLATNLDGVFAGGDAVLGPDLAVRAVAAGRIAAQSIDRRLRGLELVAEEQTRVTMQPVDDEERAAIFREIERASRVETTTLGGDLRRSTFDEVVGTLSDAQALSESRRCMSCGCAKAQGCGLRTLATRYGADPGRFLGRRRRFEQDRTHPEIVYEPGKCILCDACVRIAADAGEDLGLSPIGRGFDVSVSVPFDRPLSEGLRLVARRCAEACPTGALALRTARSCDLADCGGCPRVDPDRSG